MNHRNIFSSKHTHHCRFFFWQVAIAMSKSGLSIVRLLCRHGGFRDHHCFGEKREKRIWGGVDLEFRRASTTTKNLWLCSRTLTREFLTLMIHFSQNVSLEILSLMTRVAHHVHVMIPHTTQGLHPFEFPPPLDIDCLISLHFADQSYPPFSVDPSIRGFQRVNLIKRHKRSLREKTSDALIAWLMTHFHGFRVRHLQLGFRGGIVYDLTCCPPLQRLTLGMNFNRSLKDQLPPSITHLMVGPKFDQAFSPSDLPKLRHFHVLECPSVADYTCPEQTLSTLTTRLKCLKIFPLLAIDSLPFCDLLHRFSRMHHVTLSSHHLLRGVNAHNFFVFTPLGYTTSGKCRHPSQEEMTDQHPSVREMCFFTPRDRRNLSFWLTSEMVPCHLVSLTLPRNFVGPMSLPFSLRILKIHPKSKFNGLLDSVTFPPTLTTIFFNDRFSQSIKPLSRLPHLKNLRLGLYFAEPIYALPPSLQFLIIGNTPLCSIHDFPSSRQSILRSFIPQKFFAIDSLGQSSFSSSFPFIPSSVRLVLVGRRTDQSQEQMGIFNHPHCPECTLVGPLDLFKDSFPVCPPHSCSLSSSMSICSQQ